MALSTLAQGALGNAVLRRAKLSWLGYGVGAYVALRLMKRYGIMEKQADTAIGFIERTTGMSRFMGHKQSRQAAATH